MPFVRPPSLYAVPSWRGTQLPTRQEVAAALLCPIPPTSNPNGAAAHAHALQWLDRFVVHSEPGWVVRAKRASMTAMVAGFYPTCDLERLCIATDYLSWAFGLDDVGDETAAGERPERLIGLFEEFERVFEGRKVSEPQAVALADIVRRLERVATDRHITDFVIANRAYFGAMLWEANNRAAGLVPDEGTYILLRPAAGAVPPFFALAEPLEQIALDETTKAAPQVEKLVKLAGGIVCWINDVLSYEKERAKGDLHNLAFVYEHHRGLAPARALAEAVGFSNASVADFLEAEAALPSFGPEQDREVQRYVATLRSMIRVTLDWTLGSARYAEAG